MTLTRAQRLGMGRHSVPDPDESDEQPYLGEPDSGDDYDDEHEADEPRPTSTRPTSTRPTSTSPTSTPASDYGRGLQPGHGERDLDTDYGRPGHPAADYWADDVESDHPESDSGYDEPEAPTRSFAATSTPPQRPSVSGPAHGGEWEGGEWTGSHRAVTDGRRGVSVGVIAALVTVVVVVGAIILWRFFGDALSDRSAVAAARCVVGDVAVAVIADPGRSPSTPHTGRRLQPDRRPRRRQVRQGRRQDRRLRRQVVNGFVGKWPANSVSGPPCGFPAARYRRRGSKPQPARRPSATVGRWSPRRSCSPCARS